MKKRCNGIRVALAVVGLGLFSVQAWGQGVPNWENPRVFGIHKEPPRAYGFSYPTANLAQTLDPAQSPWVRSLEGTWKFNFVPRIADRPQTFFDPMVDVSDWADIQVPGNWEPQGWGVARYLDEEYPFAPDPPHQDPQHNAVGSYRRDFDLPSDWDGMEIFLHFGGVRSAFTLWVNGHEVGYSQGSKTPAEFRITPYLQPGRNVVALEVLQYSDGSYLEGQDAWRISGIERSVWLYAEPAITQRDFFVRADFDPQTQKGSLDLEVTLQGTGDASGTRWVQAVLSDARGQMVWQSRRETKVRPGQSATLRFESGPLAVLPWTAETPTLYFVTLTLSDPQGKVQEVKACRAGFRRVEITGGQLKVNGKAVRIRGVNRCETHPLLGRTQTEEILRQDIALIKQFNINAVRLSHYPNDPRWVDLCDEYGLYVFDSANIETHGIQFHAQGIDYLSSHPDWAGAYLDRTRRMVERDKNHPSA